MFDVAVIGGGVIGGTVLRELTKYRLSVCLLEKENDVCMGQSKANSGIVHAGFDAKTGSLKAKFNVLGNKMMKKYAKDLGVKYINNGSLVVAYSESEKITLEQLKIRGNINGVEGLKILNKEELKAVEPNLSDNAVGGLLAETGGIICPYELTIAAIGNAMDNGAELFTDFTVNKIDCTDGIFTVYSEEGNSVKAKAVINCAGLNSGKIARLIGDESFNIGGRKGEYVLLDKEYKNTVNHTVFCTPTSKGKGILVSNTVDGNVLLGPTATEVCDDEPTTTEEGLNEISIKVKEMMKNLTVFGAITSFAGIRAYCDRHDFIIEESKVKKNFINVAGIESPGLTSSPAIAKYVVKNIIGKSFKLEKNKNFNGKRKPDYFFNNLTDKEKNEIIKKDPSYGKIVCRCEQITEGEIIRAIRENPKAKSVDAVKRRTRAGMGRCQGGFCQPSVMEIIAKETGTPFEKVTKFGKQSYIVVGKSK